MDAAWTICPHCELKHRPRAQSLCPRCGRTSAVARAPAVPAPVPRPAPVKAAATARAAVPAPAGEFVPTLEYLPELAPSPAGERAPPARPAEDSAPAPASTLGLGGAILLANAALHLFEFLFLPSLSSDGPLRAVQLAGTLVGVVVDTILGVGFLQGKAHLRTLALVRLVAGMVLFGGIGLYQAQFLFTLVVFAFSCGVLVLVWGKPTVTLAGVGLTAVMLSGAVEVIGFMKLASTQSLEERARISLRPDLEGRVLSHEDSIVGVRRAYSLQVPSDGWYRHKAGSPGALDAPADVWLSHPELNAHLLVAVRDNPEEAADVREAKDAALRDLRTRYPDFQETEPDEPGAAGTVLFTGTAKRNGKPFRFEVSLYPVGATLLRVTAAAPPPVFETLGLQRATTRLRAN